MFVDEEQKSMADSQPLDLFFSSLLMSLKRWPVVGLPLCQESPTGTDSHAMPMYHHKRSPCTAGSRKLFGG